MKEIKLSQGLVTLVDDEDYEELNQHTWYAQKKGKTFYAVRHSYLKGKDNRIYMHRVLLNNNSKLHTDHINGDGLDNQKANLRVITTRQNLQNIHTKKSSQYAGVSWSKRDKKWQAQIRIKGVVKHLGYFTNELEAHSIYLKRLDEIGELFVNNITEKVVTK